jgi:hypothetical protein
VQFSLKRLFAGVTAMAVVAGVARLVSAVALQAFVLTMISIAVWVGAIRWSRLDDSTHPLRGIAATFVLVVPALLLAAIVGASSAIIFVAEVGRAIFGR